MPERFEPEWLDLIERPPVGFVKAITVGSANPRGISRGFWSAELIWIDDNGELQFQPLGMSTEGCTHIQLDLLAALMAIERGRDLGLPIQINSVVKANVDTPTNYWLAWEANERAGRGFTNNRGKPPENLGLWQLIMKASEDADVSWLKRSRDCRDGFLQFQDMLDFQRYMSDMAEAKRRSN